MRCACAVCALFVRCASAVRSRLFFRLLTYTSLVAVAHLHLSPTPPCPRVSCFTFPCVAPRPPLSPPVSHHVLFLQVVCPKEVQAFMKALEKGSEEDNLKAYGALLKCNAKFQADGEKLFS